MKKKVLVAAAIELLLSVALALSVNAGAIDRDFAAALGLGNLVIGLAGCFIGVIVMLPNRETGKSILIASGLMLLLGWMTCSFFTGFK